MQGSGGDERARDDRDSPWKEALDRLLEPAMRLLFPAAHAEIDWERGWQSLDGELQQVVRDAELGRRMADKLFRVFLKGGGEAWVALHIEVQGQVDRTLLARARVYRHRIHDRYDVPVASLIVLADDSPSWRPAVFQEDVLGCRERVEFPTVKLLDFSPRTAELLRDPNPFALVVLAHLASIRTRSAPKARLQWRWMLTRALYERGHDRKDVLELLRFLDWLLALPPELEDVYVERYDRLEKECEMPYRMKFELEAEKRGEALGEARGQRRTIRSVLEARFGVLPSDLSARLEEVTDTEQLAALARHAALVPSLEGFIQDLDGTRP